MMLNNNLFSENPTNIDIRRSKFPRNSTHKTTFNAGDIIPIYVDLDILPGDTVEMDVGSAVRMSTSTFPVMDNAYLDLAWYFVPNRLLWDHWKQFMGENDTAPWAQTIQYTMPQTTAPSGGWTKGTIADHMGIPTEVDNISVDSRGFRALAKIWNDWYRDQNLKNPAYLTTGDSTTAGSNGTSYVTDVEKGGMPPKVAKIHDQFTSALPDTQKGPAVTVPIGTTAPVYATKNVHNVKSIGDPTSIIFLKPGAGAQWSEPQFNPIMARSSTDLNRALLQTYETANTDTGTKSNMYPVNLWADLVDVTGSTINQLRQAFQVQKYYETLSRSGSRYIEVIKSFFGVTSPDGRQQRSEYLGGCRININMDQVIQTSETGTTNKGSVSGNSLTNFAGSQFTKSFTEHGVLMCLAYVRTKHSYQQGLEKMWSRKKATDFYWPTFANLGNLPVYNKEIFAQGTATDDQAFGYQEAWYEYRYKPDIVTGEFRSNYATSLDAWHYADDYASLPILGTTWIDETSANISRTIAVSERLADQFIGDFYFKANYVRAMPMYSIPGLIDHH